MRLEQTLQMYEVGRSETFEMSVYNISNRLYELYTGGSGGIKINTRLYGGLELDLNKSTKNTTILKERLDQINNTYIHHDKGPGRMTTTTKK